MNLQNIQLVDDKITINAPEHDVDITPEMWRMIEDFESRRIDYPNGRPIHGGIDFMVWLCSELKVGGWRAYWQNEPTDTELATKAGEIMEQWLREQVAEWVKQSGLSEVELEEERERGREKGFEFYNQMNMGDDKERLNQ